MNKISKGNDLKYRVKSSIPDFTLADDEFDIVIKNQWGQIRATIQKKDCYRDSEGSWYFNFENVQTGIYDAVFYAKVPDNDFSYLIRKVVDEQRLCVVGIETQVQQTGDHPVTYEQIWTVNLDNGVYLADENGNPIITADGRKIKFSTTEQSSRVVQLGMTGAEFQQLIEGRNPNGDIDTVPELLDAVQNINDETEMGVMTEEDAHQLTNEIFGV